MEEKKINEYLEKVEIKKKLWLEEMRKWIKEEVPEAVEIFSYGMPGFKYKGKYLVGYAAFNDHMSFFPTPEPIEELKDKLGDYKLAKGTIQFTLEKPLSQELISELLRSRVKAIG